MRSLLSEEANQSLRTQLKELEKENDQLKTDLDEIMSDNDITTFECGQYKAECVVCYELISRGVGSRPCRWIELWETAKANIDKDDGI